MDADARVGDDDNDSATAVIGEDYNNNDKVDDGKDAVNNQRKKKIMNELFFNIPINSQKILEIKRKKDLIISTNFRILRICYL